MWRPTKIGIVVAERSCEFLRPAARGKKLTIAFGRPVRARSSVPGEPWWCPVEIKGAGFDRFDSIGGQDSVQALLLAVAYIEQWLTGQAKKRGGRMGSYGIAGSPILGHSSLKLAKPKRARTSLKISGKSERRAR